MKFYRGTFVYLHLSQNFLILILPIHAIFFFWGFNIVADQMFKYIVRNSALPIHYVQHGVHLLSWYSLF